MLERLRSRARRRARNGRWRPLAVIGALSVVAGVVMIVWPVPSLGVVAVLIGGWLLCAGGMRVATALLARSGSRDSRRMSVFAGLASVAGGGVCLVRPDATVRLFAAVLAVQWIAGGVADVVDGLRH